MTRQISISTTNESEARFVELNFRLDTPSNTLTFVAPLRPEGYFVRLGSVEKVLLHKLFAIEGITHVVLEVYRVKVGKAALFEWDDLEPQIVDAFKLCWSGLELAEEKLEKSLSDYLGYREFMAWGNEQGISLARMSHIWQGLVRWSKFDSAQTIDQVELSGERHGREVAFARLELAKVSPEALRVASYPLTAENAEIFRRFQDEYLKAGRRLQPLEKSANKRNG